MKKIISIICTSLLLTGGFYVFAIDQGNSIACTMDYSPICAKVQVQCIKAPCYPVYETFSNKCMMSSNPLAQFAYTGECKSENLDNDEIKVSDEFKTKVENVLGKYMNDLQFKTKFLEAVDNMLKVENIQETIKNKLLYLKKYLSN